MTRQIYLLKQSSNERASETLQAFLNYIKQKQNTELAGVKVRIV